MQTEIGPVNTAERGYYTSNESNMTRDNSSTRKEVHDENETEDAVVYLEIYGKFHSNRPGIGKSMIRLEELNAPDLTSTPSSFGPTLFFKRTITSR
jgi:hypothetical protein